MLASGSTLFTQLKPDLPCWHVPEVVFDSGGINGSPSPGAVVGDGARLGDRL
ncbi:hypothetical protein ACFFX0_11385 [Citricoccus parietis]|uniref:Uncharacterized protein n=1 Tax=Citricoccus parietis TaxID=592307 RepID=A0ABV5FYM0_9MICC